MGFGLVTIGAGCGAANERHDETSVVPTGAGGAAERDPVPADNSAELGGSGPSGAGSFEPLGAGGVGGLSEPTAGAGTEGTADPNTSPSNAACPEGPYASNPVPEGAVVTTLCSGLIFTEGPVWVESLGSVFFSDIDVSNPAMLQAGATMKYTASAGCEVFTERTGTNGLSLMPDGRLLAARYFEKVVSIVDPVTKESSELVSDYMGTVLNSPNDISIRSDGNIYFSDPAWEPVLLPHSLYHRAPTGELTPVILDGRRPNGVTLSPDEQTLYVSVENPNEVLAFAVAVDGTLSDQRSFIADGSDGMGIDCAGNLYLTGEGSVRVYNEQAQFLAEIAMPDAGMPDPTNVAFGGAERKTLYITGAGFLRAVELDIPGYPF